VSPFRPLVMLVVNFKQGGSQATFAPVMSIDLNLQGE
jgi:hypothetical protein